MDESSSIADSPDRQVIGLAAGTKIGLGIAALLVVWATMTLYWPVVSASADGQVQACGSAASLVSGAGDACATATGQFRLQAVTLYAAAVVVSVTAFSVFGTRWIHFPPP